jgi:hypothetical protein
LPVEVSGIYPPEQSALNALSPAIWHSLPRIRRVNKAADVIMIGQEARNR